MALTREPGSEIIANFTTPVKGTWNSAAIHTVPTDALHDSMNVFVRESKIQNRPGLALLNNTLFDTAVLGGGLAVTPTENRVIAVTNHALYELGPFDTAWNKTSSLLFANSIHTPIDMAFLETAGKYVGLIASQDFELKQWDNVLHTTGPIVASKGTVPKAKSVCISARRVVALVPPHTLNWSATLDHTSWSALSYNKLAQTNDLGICVKSLSNLAFACYKERSIYLARAQGTSDGGAFSMNEPINVEGPAGVHAVVVVGGAHIYMTKNGRIAMFDGTNYPKWIADGIWLFLQRDINPQFSHLISGVYDYRLHTVTFFYPRSSDPGTLQGMVTINLPFEGMDIAGTQIGIPACYLGVCAKSVSFATEIRFNNVIDRSLLFTDEEFNNQSFIMDEEVLTDDDVEFDCSMTTGLVSMPDARHTNVVVETFVERNEGYGIMNIAPVVSDMLESKSGETPDLSEQTISLEFNPVRRYLGFNKPTRFFGLKYSWKSKSRVRYAGAIVYGKGYV